ncbi:RsmB/NOP family class I SAM-dependent RNA methyltransferase [Sterolibacterium denitrificans]|nr:RsmB/NOP family class I SAM-dependent RNA methyltransferase [Sterolibacterium denitrificans]
MNRRKNQRVGVAPSVPSAASKTRRPAQRRPHAASAEKTGGAIDAGLSSKVLDQAAIALRRLLAFERPADAVLSDHFREQRSLGRRERGFIAETCYAVLRHRRQLERLVQPEVTPRRLLLACLLRYSGFGLRQLAGLLLPGEQDWLLALRSAAETDCADCSLAERLDLPDWLTERLSARHTEAELVELARGLNRSAPLDLRVNLLKTTRDEVLRQLAATGIKASACPYSPWGIRLEGKPALQQHPLFLQGHIEVQDEGSQLLGALLAPRRGEMVVDFCAGAGGKTLLLGAMMRSTGRLYAFDVSSKRLAKLKPRVARSGLSNVHPVCIDNENDVRVKRLAGKIDRVLVDAPCSGLGTLRRNPDLKWRQTAQDVAELVRKQQDILAAAARLVKPGGRLVYATCSILDEENAGVVDHFLAGHAAFQRLDAAAILAQQGILIDCGMDMRLLPHVHGTDGFYAAVLERGK